MGEAGDLDQISTVLRSRPRSRSENRPLSVVDLAMAAQAPERIGVEGHITILRLLVSARSLPAMDESLWKIA